MERKLRGQNMMIELLVYFIILIMGIFLAPTIGQAVNTGFSNATLFPTNGPAYLVGNLIPFIWIAILIIIGLMVISRRNSEGG